jgi:hypothetical protein
MDSSSTSQIFGDSTSYFSVIFFSCGESMRNVRGEARRGLDSSVENSAAPNLASPARPPFNVMSLNCHLVSAKIWIYPLKASRNGMV